VEERSGDDVEHVDSQRDKIRIINTIIRTISFRTLSGFYKLSTERLTLMRTFSTWKSIRSYLDGGTFLDVRNSILLHGSLLKLSYIFQTLSANIRGIRLVLAAKGGWKEALAELSAAANWQEDTKAWPDFFRVRVLELYRQRLAAGAEERSVMNAALKDELEVEKQKNAALTAAVAAEAHRRTVAGPHPHTLHPHSHVVPHPHNHNHAHNAGHDHNHPPVHAHHAHHHGHQQESSPSTARKSSVDEENGAVTVADKAGPVVPVISELVSSVVPSPAPEPGMSTTSQSSAKRISGRFARATGFEKSLSGLSASAAGDNRPVDSTDAQDGGGNNIMPGERPLSPRSVRDTILQIASQKLKSRKDKSRKLHSLKEVAEGLMSKNETTDVGTEPISDADIATGTVVNAVNSNIGPASTGTPLSSARNSMYERSSESSASRKDVAGRNTILFKGTEDAAGEAAPDAPDFEDVDAQIASAVLKKQRLSTRSVSVKMLARENLVKQMSMHNFLREDDVDEGDSAPGSKSSETSTSAVNMAAMEGKMSTALAATTAILETSLLATKNVEPSVAVLTARVLLQEQALDAASEAKVASAEPSLHKLADDVGFLLLGGEDDCEILIEIILEAIDCWLDGYQSQAVEMLSVAEEYCSFPSETTFVRSLLDKVRVHTVVSGGCKGELNEIFDKLNSVLSVRDLFSEIEADFEEQMESKNRAIEAQINSSRKSPIPVASSRASSRMSRRSTRGPTPEHMDALKLSLQDNRLKRLQDRDDARQIAASMKENVAEAIASALTAVATESVDIGIQTERGDEDDNPGPITDDVDGDDNYLPSMTSGKETMIEEPMEVVSAAPTFSTVMAVVPPGTKLSTFI
jgi:hypothetical protein